MKASFFPAFLAALFTAASASGQWYSFNDLDSRYFNDPGFGGRSGTISQVTFMGRECIRKTLDAGTETYSFIGTEKFHPEDWSSYTGMKLDFYYTYSDAGSDQVYLKLEPQHDSGGSVNQDFSGLLARDTWHTITISFGIAPSNYSDVARVFMSIEDILANETITAYWSNFRLTNGSTDTPWDGTTGGNRNLFYTADAVDSGYDEPVTANQTHDGTAAAEIHWSGAQDGADYAEVAHDPISPAQNLSSVNQIRFWVRTDDTNLLFKPFFWDGGSGYAPAAQSVGSPNTWTLLSFDIQAMHSAITSANITAFKIVAENTNYGSGTNTGVFFVDTIELNDSLGVDGWQGFIGD